MCHLCGPDATGYGCVLLPIVAGLYPPKEIIASTLMRIHPQGVERLSVQSYSYIHSAHRHTKLHLKFQNFSVLKGCLKRSARAVQLFGRLASVPPSPCVIATPLSKLQ